MPKNRKQQKKSGHYVQQDSVQALDRLAAYEEFCEQVLPALRKDLAKGLPAVEMYIKYQAIAAARGITIAATSTQESAALAAVKDILDRTQGKAVERKIVAGKFDGLSDQGLRALVATELSEDDSDQGEEA